MIFRFAIFVLFSRILGKFLFNRSCTIQTNRDLKVVDGSAFVNSAPFTGGDNTLTNDTQSINSAELNYFIMLVYSLSYSGCVKSYSETLGEVPINILHSLTS